MDLRCWTAFLLLGAGAGCVHDRGHSHGTAGRTAAPVVRTIRVTQAPDNGANPWSHLDFHNDPAAFQFAIVADRHGGNRPGIFEEAIRKLNLLQPEFVMCVGDLIEGYSHDPAMVKAQWDEFQGLIRVLEMPFFYVPGNHDQTNPTMAGLWQERFGRSYYSFVYRDVLFLCLNSQDPPTHQLGAAQAQWVRDTLAAHPAVRWTLVFLHTPLWEEWEEGTPGDRRWQPVEAALQGRNHTVFAGHNHTYLKRGRHGARYYTLATTGGGSDLRGTAYGEVDQVAWVTMTDTGPVVANLLLDGIQSDDIRTPVIKAAVDALASNVFTSDIIWLSGATPPARSLEIRSANPSTVPVDITFQLTAHDGLAAKLSPSLAATFDGRSIFTLPPKGSRTFELQLAGELPTHPHQAQVAAKLAWEARLQPAGSGPLQLKESVIIPIVPVLKLPAIEGPVGIDGAAADWPDALFYAVTDTPALRSDREGWTGPADCSFRLGFARDAINLYAIVEVKDDSIVSRAALPPWKQDGIELRMDFRPPAVQRAPQVDENGLLVIGASPAPGDGLDPGYIVAPSSLPAGTTVCTRRTAEGYIFEAAIPLQALVARYGNQWEKDGLRVNVAVNDHDGSEQAQLWWQPDWRTLGNIPGSGTLFP
jgi:hypothetical protein